jgi:hypothetical protein
MDARQQQRFTDLVEQTLREYGAQPYTHRPEELRLITRIGTLTIRLVEAGKQYCSIHTAFLDPPFASRFVNCNPYSGKWNFQYDVKGKVVAETPLALFIHSLKKILPTAIDSHSRVPTMNGDGEGI